MSTEDRWTQIEMQLTRLGVSEAKRFRVREIRSHMDRITSLGIQTMPDFTLHNITHSDNLIRILDQLKKLLGFTLGEYEAYLLAAAAYLHDLGMYFNERQYRDELLPDIESKLRVCPQDKCDHIKKYGLSGQNIANDIRLIHHLISAYWLLNTPPTLFGIEPGDQPYLATVCRGHRGANLCETECDCYKTVPQDGEQLRIGAISGLLRLSDALDFYRNRAPEEVLEGKVYDFLYNPIALGHWLKHYFVSDPYITLSDDRGNKILECQIVVAVPDETIASKTYQEFMRPLFDEHIAEANRTDFDIQQYPPVFINLAGITAIRATLSVDKRAGHRKLPHRITNEVVIAKSQDIVAFLKAKQAAGAPPSNPNVSVAPVPTNVQSSPTIVERQNGQKRILVLCPLFGASNIYYSSLLTAIMDCAARYDYALSIQAIKDVRYKRPLHTYAPLPSLSGVIAITCQVAGSSWLKECRDAGLPLVLIHDNIEESNLKDSTVVSYLWPDLDGLRDLVSHLIRDHQRRNLCVVMVNAHGHRVRQQKLDIIRNTVQQAGLRDLDVTDREHLFHVHAYTHVEGRSIVGEILETNPTVDAIVCLADVTAIGILSELRERKRGDILVTGFDDIDLAEQFQLTSVDQQIETTGDRALVDLHRAIQNRIFGFTQPTYIPTTLKKRASCCAPTPVRFQPRNPVQRFAIYYLIENNEILNMIRNVHYGIYALSNRMENTNELLGNAPLFPPHVTLKGIFQLSPQVHLQEFLNTLTQAITPLDRFCITVKDVRPYPEKSISLGFDGESDEKMRRLQERILKITDSFRNRKIIEPEFRSWIRPDANSLAMQHTVEHGEPFIGELFHPHITIVSGVQNNADRGAIETLINMPRLAGCELEVDKITVVYETMLGSSWEILKEIPLT